jgi:membrane protease YdiL (CAAX protease family)
MSAVQAETIKPAHPNPVVIILAWAVVLCISDLPEIFWQSITSESVSFQGFKLAVLGILLLFTLLFDSLRALWQFPFVFLVFYLLEAGVNWLVSSPLWPDTNSFAFAYLNLHSVDVLLALTVIAALWLAKRHRTDFHLTRGQVNAPIEPVRWLGIRQGESWRVFGWIFTACTAVAILSALAGNVPLTAEALLRALPLLPVAVLLAALNAFTEETYYRASMLSTLTTVLGRKQALLLSCAFFGLAHIWLARRPACPASY